MKKSDVTVTLTWSEAMNLISAVSQVDTRGWTRASRGALDRALEKLVTVTPLPDLNSVFLVVRGQTVVKHVPAAPEQ